MIHDTSKQKVQYWINNGLNDTPQIEGFNGRDGYGDGIRDEIRDGIRDLVILAGRDLMNTLWEQ